MHTSLAAASIGAALQCAPGGRNDVPEKARHPGHTSIRVAKNYNPSLNFTTKRDYELNNKNINIVILSFRSITIVRSRARSGLSQKSQEAGRCLIENFVTVDSHIEYMHYSINLINFTQDIARWRAKPAVVPERKPCKTMKLCKFYAMLQGVWIIARTVKPLLKITSGIPERATLHGTLISAIACTNAHTRMHARLFSYVLAKLPTAILC